MSSLVNRVQGLYCNEHGKQVEGFCIEPICKHIRRTVCFRCISSQVGYDLVDFEEVDRLVNEYAQWGTLLKCRSLLMQQFQDFKQTIIQQLDKLEGYLDVLMSQLVGNQIDIGNGIDKLNLIEMEQLGGKLAGCVNRNEQHELKLINTIEDQCAYRVGRRIIQQLEEVDNRLDKLLKGDTSGVLNNDFNEIIDKVVVKQSCQEIQHTEESTSISIESFPQQFLSMGYMNMMIVAKNRQQSNTIQIGRCHNGNSCSLVQTLSGHDGYVGGLCFNRQSNILASGSIDIILYKWNGGHTDIVNQLVFNNDDSILASSSNDRTIKLWQLLNDNDDCYTLRGHNDSVMTIQFSNNSMLLASGGLDNRVIIWSRQQQDIWIEQSILDGHTDAVLGLSFNNDSTILISCGRDNTIRVWIKAYTDMWLCQSILQEHIASVNSVVFIDMNIFGSCSTDGQLMLWRIDEYKVCRVFKRYQHNQAILSMGLSRCNTKLVYGVSDDSFYIRNIIN